MNVRIPCTYIQYFRLFIFLNIIDFRGNDALTLTHLPPGTQVDHGGETGIAQVAFAFVYLDHFWVFGFAAEDNIGKQIRVVPL